MEQERLTPMQAYKVGDIVDYKVKQPLPNYCELIDEETGITTYLQGTAKLFLHKGQTLKCRVYDVRPKHPMIELVDISVFEQSKDNLTEEKLTKQLESRDILWNTKEFVKLLLAEEKDKSFESRKPRAFLINFAPARRTLPQSPRNTDGLRTPNLRRLP